MKLVLLISLFSLNAYADNVYYRCLQLFDSKQYLTQSYEIDQNNHCSYTFSSNDKEFKSGKVSHMECDRFMEMQLRKGFVCISSHFF